MSHKPNAVPVLQEGTVYTIILDNGRKVHDVIYHACVASGKSYFANLSCSNPMKCLLYNSMKYLTPKL